MTLLDTTSVDASTPALADRLPAALADGPASLAALARDGAPRDRRDRVLALLALYDVATRPAYAAGPGVRWLGHPAVAEIKQRLEGSWLAELDAAPLPADLPREPVAGMRALAARDRLPRAYRWLAREATWPELVHFLAVEGGPDGGIDDLIAVGSVGLAGSAKAELAQNWWDEQGGGKAELVHTTLHHQMAAAVGMPRIPREELPVEALERVALAGLLATNRWLQPELLGAVGLLELQAGPRCRLVLQAFSRLGAPEAAVPFYAEHADVDPRHGKDWLDKAIAPLCAEHPEWTERVLRGAWWRSQTNRALFELLGPQASAGPRASAAPGASAGPRAPDQ